MPVRMSVYQLRLEENVIFLAANYEIGLIFHVHFHLIYEHLLYKCFVPPSVGQAKKGTHVCNYKQN